MSEPKGIERLISEYEDTMFELSLQTPDGDHYGECADDVVQAKEALLAAYAKLKAENAKLKIERDAFVDTVKLDPRIAAWRALDAGHRAEVVSFLDVYRAGLATRRSIFAASFGIALEALEAIGERGKA